MGRVHPRGGREVDSAGRLGGSRLNAEQEYCVDSRLSQSVMGSSGRGLGSPGCDRVYCGWAELRG